MKHLLIDKGMLTVNLDDELNNVTGEQLNALINESYLAEDPNKAKDFYYISVGLIIRNVYKNEVIVWDNYNEEVVKSRWVKEDTDRQLQGYFLLMQNVQAMLLEKVSIPQSVILKTVLQPVGVIKYEDELKVVFHLIVPDEPEEPITFKSNGGNQLVVEKIENVQNFTNPSLWTKMILPTLKIVGGNDSESKDSREQGL
jgi:hypothetical protein